MEARLIFMVFIMIAMTVSQLRCQEVSGSSDGASGHDVVISVNASDNIHSSDIPESVNSVNNKPIQDNPNKNVIDEQPGQQEEYTQETPSSQLPVEAREPPSNELFPEAIDHSTIEIPDEVMEPPSNELPAETREPSTVEFIDAAKESPTSELPTEAREPSAPSNQLLAESREPPIGHLLDQPDQDREPPSSELPVEAREPLIIELPLEDREPPINDISVDEPQVLSPTTISSEVEHSQMAQAALEIDDDETEVALEEAASKHPGSPTLPLSPSLDCSKITMQNFQVMLQNPDAVEPEDYSCGLLKLISHFEKDHARIRTLEGSLQVASKTIQSLEDTLREERESRELITKELNETLTREADRAIKAENVIARRVISEKSRVDTMQKNLTDYLSTAMEHVEELEVIVKKIEVDQEDTPMKASSSSVYPFLSSSYKPLSSGLSFSSDKIADRADKTKHKEDLRKLEDKITSLQDLVQSLTIRMKTLEDDTSESVDNSKGLSQIFKTYASLANDIDKERDRAVEEETNMKKFILAEVGGLSKDIDNLRERISEEKQRVQAIENRRSADLSEEITRAKTEEAKITQKLKEEMMKAVAAFKRLEIHVDTQLNETQQPLEDRFAFLEGDALRRWTELDVKLSGQISMEKTRALSQETSLKVHLETEISRAMAAENELKRITNEDRERQKLSEKDLQSQISVETMRAKAAELSITSQITEEVDRAKKEEAELFQLINGNLTKIQSANLDEILKAQNAYQELTSKIQLETSRAVTAEQGLLTTLNQEITRLSSTDADVVLLKKRQEKSDQDLESIRLKVDAEVKRATGKEITLENQILTEVKRAKNEEAAVLLKVNTQLEIFKMVEANMTQTGIDALRHTRELELEVRKTVMAEVARAVDAENSLRAHIREEADRAQDAELKMEQFLRSNVTLVTEQVQRWTQERDKHGDSLEMFGLQIQRNVTQDLATLSELFDDKLDDLEKSENVRLKRLEDGMKKCCGSTGWRWRNSKENGVELDDGKKARNGLSEGVMRWITHVFGDDVNNGEPTEENVESRSVRGRLRPDVKNLQKNIDNDKPHITYSKVTRSFGRK